MRTSTLHTEAGDVTIREWGQETAAPGRLLLALHAMGPVSTGALYNCGVGPLVAAGYHVVAPDLPGYGLTAPLAPEDYDVALLAGRAWQWVEALGVGRITLIGHSWGGAIATRMHLESPDAVDALVLVDSGHVDYADVNGADADLSLDEWVQRAWGRRIVAADRAALAEAIEIDAGDPLMDDLVLAMAEEGGQLVPRLLPEAQGAALFHLGRARQTETWPALAEQGTPTLLLLATEPEAAREQNERAGAAFGAAVPQADVRMVQGATHSLVTDLREEFGRSVADWLAGHTPSEGAAVDRRIVRGAP
jgi:pimeloyl-ACP methyl ester carboxylesterase